jgi:DNA polymerase-4
MAARLRQSGWVANRVVVKIRRRDFRTFTRQARIRPPTHATAPLAQAAAQLLDQWLSVNRGAAIRLLGVGATDLSMLPQLDMFAAQESARDEKLDSALDEIRAKFGTQAVGRASSLRPQR